MSAFYLGAMFTYVASSTFVFQDGFGMTAQQFGWVFAGGAVAITAGSQVNGALVGRFTPEQVLSGTVVAGLALSTSLFVTTLADGPLWLVVTLLILTLGTAGFVLPSAPAIALANNPHRAGSAAALLGALQFGLGALIAPLTSIGGTPTAESMAGRHGRDDLRLRAPAGRASAARGIGSPRPSRRRPASTPGSTRASRRRRPSVRGDSRSRETRLGSGATPAARVGTPRRRTGRVPCPGDPRLWQANRVAHVTPRRHNLAGSAR